MRLTLVLALLMVSEVVVEEAVAAYSFIGAPRPGCVRLNRFRLHCRNRGPRQADLGTEISTADPIDPSADYPTVNPVGSWRAALFTTDSTDPVSSNSNSNITISNAVDGGFNCSSFAFPGFKVPRSALDKAFLKVNADGDNTLTRTEFESYRDTIQMIGDCVYGNLTEP